MSESQYREMPYPSSRQFTFDVGKIGLGKHHVKALLEVDISKPWQIVRNSRQTGQKISFTAWLIKVIADCVALHPPVAGINRARRNKVVVFDDVDISIVVEKEVNGVRVPLPYVIRKADKKSLHEIHDEIESAKSQTVEDESDYVLGSDSGPAGMKFFVRLPQWLRLILFRLFFLNNPQRTKDAMGSVMVTTVGMVGHTHGWIIPYSMHPLCLALGSINVQPLIHRGNIEKGEVLHMAVLVDHDVIDGIPAARFVDDLVRKLEAGFGL
jgi:pyruvate/2-oxoglutarate dehydrogenase complex dihydrolipoamide acyltransferase (E2) component